MRLTSLVTLFAPDAMARVATFPRPTTSCRPSASNGGGSGGILGSPGIAILQSAGLTHTNDARAIARGAARHRVREGAAPIEETAVVARQILRLGGRFGRCE